MSFQTSAFLSHLFPNVVFSFKWLCAVLPVVKLGRYAAVGMDYVIQVMAVALLVAVHAQTNR